MFVIQKPTLCFDLPVRQISEAPPLFIMQIKFCYLKTLELVMVVAAHETLQDGHATRCPCHRAANTFIRE